MGNQVLIIPVLITELLPLILSVWLTRRTQTSKDGSSLPLLAFPPRAFHKRLKSYRLSCSIQLCWVFPCSVGALHWGRGFLQLKHVGASSCGMQASLLCSVWDLSSPTRDQTCILCFGRQIFNHWITIEVSHWSCFKHERDSYLLVAVVRMK